MIDDFKKILLAGVGVVATSYEKSNKMLDEMVQKGKLTVDEGKELSEELKRTLKKDAAPVQQDAKAPEALTKESLKELFAEMNLVSKDDLKSLQERIEKLEEK